MKLFQQFVFTALFAFLASCDNNPSTTEDGLITIDVSKSYPEKELILQDFMDVEYIPLETNDDFLTQGTVLDISENYIAVKNWGHDGDIFFFDRHTGKAIRKINRKGQGGEEYVFVNRLILDEEKDEMYINCATSKRIFVYDLQGKYKRSFKHPNDGQYIELWNFDKDNLIGYDESNIYNDEEPRAKAFYHALISKQDGSVTTPLPIPYETIVGPLVRVAEGATATMAISAIAPNYGDVLLIDTSCDTIYNYSAESRQLQPLFVRTPTNDPVVFLTAKIITDQYYFLETQKRSYSIETRKGFERERLVYDKEEKTIHEVTVLNRDLMMEETFTNWTIGMNNHRVVAFETIQADKLYEAYHDNKLTGKLKEIAANLKEDDNPVVMIVKNKK